jgi:pilus assembly protein Flp/PilA
MKRILARFAADERGVTAMEYGLIASLVAIALVVVLGRVGAGLNTTFDTIATDLADGGSAN